MSGVFDFKRWYAANAEALSERRKARYHGDPEYRAKVLAINAEARKVKRAARARERALEDKARQVGLLPPAPEWKTVMVEVNGQQVPAFTIGALAKALGRSIQAIRQYEQKGLVPVTPYRSPKGDRLYTFEMVSEIRTELEKLGRVGHTGKRKRPAAKLYRVRLSTGELRDVPLFRISYLSKACNRSISMLEHMEPEGLFPLTPFRPKKIRLYSAEMIESARYAFEGVDSGRLTREEAAAVVASSWEDFGYLNATLVGRLLAPAESDDQDDDSALRTEAEAHDDEQTQEGLNGHDDTDDGTGDGYAPLSEAFRDD